MAENQDSDQRLVELQNETLKRENEMLTRENAALREMSNNLKRSLEEAVQHSRAQASERGPRGARDSPPTGDTHEDPIIIDLRASLKQKDEELTKTVQQLNEARKQLSGVQDRLTVYEQVTVATQRRVLQQEGVCEDVLTQNIYEQLRPEITDHHEYAELRPAAETGSFCCHCRYERCYCGRPPLPPAMLAAGHSTVCGKKVSPKVFRHFLSNRSEFLHEISHIYYSFIVT